MRRMSWRSTLASALLRLATQLKVCHALLPPQERAALPLQQESDAGISMPYMQTRSRRRRALPAPARAATAPAGTTARMTQTGALPAAKRVAPTAPLRTLLLRRSACCVRQRRAIGWGRATRSRSSPWPASSTS